VSEVFYDVDVVLAPTTPFSAPPIGAPPTTVVAGVEVPMAMSVPTPRRDHCRSAFSSWPHPSWRRVCFGSPPVWKTTASSPRRWP